MDNIIISLCKFSMPTIIDRLFQSNLFCFADNLSQHKRINQQTDMQGPELLHSDAAIGGPLDRPSSRGF
jgi:hypothetical protein